MELTRATVLSVIHGLKNQLHYEDIPTYDGTGLAFPTVKILTRDQDYTEMVAPCIVAYPGSQFERELQIGGGFYLNTLFTFDIYATRDGELYTLVDVVRHYLETTDEVKNYDAGFPSYQVLDGKIREVYSGTVPQPLSMMYFSDTRVQYLDRATLVGESRAHRAQVTALVEVTTVN